jgi:hypothetical protein
MFAVANLVNDNGNTSGDSWNNKNVSFAEATSSVGIATVAISTNAYPNPVFNSLNLAFNSGSGSYTVHVFDLNGHMVASEVVSVNTLNQVATINTATWAPGMYHAIIEKDGNREILALVKQ